MPTYEYKCDACGNEFEQMQGMKDEPIKKCPKCGKLKVKRLISSDAGIVFKGSGFYATDYKKSGTSSDKKSTGKKGKAPCGKDEACSSCDAV
ncbi:MAG: zinc ribbon domain-containing protein [Candidatus Omnitrophica bacterium]|nr:zinc ribbon domain-containing protein [Candidatus Omnitrophota bacterium]